MEIIVACLLLFPNLAQPTNLISNFSFESPIISNNNWLVNVATGWSGINFDLINFNNYLGFGQFVDLARGVGQNGYIEQNVTILN